MALVTLFGTGHRALEALNASQWSHWRPACAGVARCVAVPVITFAHRGARLVEPENTIPAFRRALDAGATGIETDVWLSDDGEVVCTHDPVVGRGLRRRKVAASSAAELATLGVPSFADVYAELGTAFDCSVDVRCRRPPGRSSTWPGGARRWSDSGCAHRTSSSSGVAVGGERPARALHAPAGDRRAYGASRIRARRPSGRRDEPPPHRMELPAWSRCSTDSACGHSHGTPRRRQLRCARMGIDAVYCDRPDRMVAVVSEWTESNDGDD